MILVHSTSHALKTEKVFQQAGLTCKLIPVPRQLSSDCGVCVRILRTDHERTAQLLESAHIETDGIFNV